MAKGTSKTDRRQPQFGSDLIVDLMKAFDIEYAAFNPGSSFRGIHDSIVNYGGNRNPQVIFCCHEEIPVAIAHGYAKAKGKPMASSPKRSAPGLLRSSLTYPRYEKLASTHKRWKRAYAENGP